jgi:DNA primase
MRFPPSLLDEIRTRLPVSQVVARKVALKRAGREMRGLSPFKQERTPSFFVNDHKGSWFDFSSGQNGDIFKFLMLTEGLSFPEAVERLAEEAGLPVPAASQREAEQEDQRTRQFALLQAASRFFEEQLAKPVGADAKRYLAKRGLAAETIARFKLGYAPDSKSALKEHLAKAGFTSAEIAGSGMVITGDDIPVSYDRFRHRVMFPICDLKGRVIAFGGRALDPNAQAKYLNSPETLLFHKGSVLFNAHNARKPAHDRRRIIVVEGYMDVIALSEAGFPETVAPLGTALTEDQVRALWRITPEPILCFDGDAAGRRAAFRAVETVLPHLVPGQSVQFAFLPGGLDPDDLIRQQGPEAFQAILERTSPLFDVLIEREEQQGGHPAMTPEQRASLETRLKTLVGRIGDRGVRTQYEQELRQTLWAKTNKETKELAGADGRRGLRFVGKRRNNAQLDWRIAERARIENRPRRLPRGTNPATLAVRSNELAGQLLPLPPREALLLCTLLNHPWLLESHCEAVAEITLTSKPLARLREALLQILASHTDLERAELRSHLTSLGLDRVVAMAERAITHKSDKFAEPEADAHDVEAGWRHAVALHEAQVGLKRALEAAEQAYRAEPSEDSLARILEIQQELGRGQGREAAGPDQI